MNRTKIFALILAVLMILTALSGCNAEPAESSVPETSEEQSLPAEPSSESSPLITITDMTGKEITLDGPANRIVALTASDCEILYAIGAGDLLVGRGEYCDYPAEVESVPALQSGDNTNIEQIITLQPQVLIMSAMAQTEEQIAQLEDAGIKVVVSDAQDIDGVYTAIEMIGALTGKSDEAAVLIDSMKNTFSTLSAEAAEKNADGTAKTVYFEISPLQYGLWTAGSGTFINEVAEMLGLTNCFADVDGWGEISEEQVIARNPDYIVTLAMDSAPEEEIMSRSGWENVTAVKNEAILNLKNNELSRPGPRLAEGAQMLFDFVYKDIV